MHTPRIPLVWQIMLGLVAGILIGALLHSFPDSRSWMVSNVLQPAGDIFIKLMKMIVVPIVFSCMVVGIAGHGEHAATHAFEEGEFLRAHLIGDDRTHILGMGTHQSAI